jgi:hypothetical protein
MQLGPRTAPHRPLVGSIPKHGATHTKGRARDAKRGTGDASRERSRISRHRRKPFAGSDLVRPVTRVTRVTRNRGPFPGGGCGGDQTRLIRHTGPPAQSVDAPSPRPSPQKGARATSCRCRETFRDGTASSLPRPDGEGADSTELAARLRSPKSEVQRAGEGPRKAY